MYVTLFPAIGPRCPWVGLDTVANVIGSPSGSEPESVSSFAVSSGVWSDPLFATGARFCTAPHWAMPRKRTVMREVSGRR